jgi:multiple sugar transport system permease protein
MEMRVNSVGRATHQQSARAVDPKLLLRAAGWIVFYAFLTALGVFMILPLLWMVSLASRPLSEVFVLPITLIPKDFQLVETIVSAVHRLPVLRFYMNSVVIAVATTLGQLIFCSLAGFGFAKYDFPGREILFTVVLSISMIPFIAIVIPLFIVVRDLGWLNSYAGLIVPSLVNPFGIFLMRQFIRELPNELIEAARMDGSSELGIYFRIILPLIRPALATLAIISFLASWDSFLWPLVVVNRTELYPLTLGLGKFKGEHYTVWNELMAVAFVSIVPSLLVYITLQRYFVKGIVMTGIKG